MVKLVEEQKSHREHSTLKKEIVRRKNDAEVSKFGILFTIFVVIYIV